MRTDGPVVIALDGSLLSDRTLEWGLREAERRGADAVLVRAWTEPDEYALGGWFPTLGDTGDDGEAKDYLDAVLARETARRPDLRITSALLHGQVVPELRTQSDDAQLLVVGPGPSRRPGHVAMHLAAHARCPVAVVRDHGESAPGAATGKVGAVVVGVDGSRASLGAAETAARAANARGAVLRLVHARPTSPAPFGPDYVPPLSDNAATDPAHRSARAVAESLLAHHPDLEVETVLVDEDPARAILAAARGAQLVVVGSRGLGAFRGMLLGSVSHEVVRDAACTVLVEHRDED
ncbi:universal stress protein [Cellulomonas alba]|uniref:Universal stress protein n=1 Tax=Cellulomonas alba TaxID=3053467 RepID=A0ABT7SD58_9CELL|nr:universal stress protein [Cellulomonas alba]MDM7854122.1 universal stress protein [Cellulomonas alba]